MRSRLALGFAVVLAACSGGGGSSIPSVPTLPWGSFRHDAGNSAVGGLINQNRGNVTLLVQQQDLPVDPTTRVPALLTLSTPAIDLNNNLVLGTSNGVASFGPDGGKRWTFAGFETATPSRGAQTGCAVCDPDVSACIPVGSVSASPTITAGNDIVFGTDAGNGQPGRLFVIHQNGNSVQCVWYFQPSADPSIGIRSSAIGLVDPLDLSLLTVYVGADDGTLYTLNSDGSVRWSVSDAGKLPITSTPALDSNSNVYLTTPDGIVSAFTSDGAVLSPFPVAIGAPPVNSAPLQPSPGFGASVYAVGSGGALFAVKPSQNGWQFPARHCSITISQLCVEDGDCPPSETCAQYSIAGSPAHLIQNFSFMSNSVSDTVVYLVDTQGTAYGVRDLTGQVFQSQLCSEDINVDCRTDSCNPTGVQPPPDVCDPSTHFCTMHSGQPCTQDTCVLNNEGFCVVANGIVSIAGAATSISGSPAVSGDPFVVVGTTGQVGAEVCARSLGKIVPGQNFTSPTLTWRGGYCGVTTSDTCVVDRDCPLGESCVAPAHCSVTTSDICTINNTNTINDNNCPSGQMCCPSGELCVFNGCIPLPDDPGPVLSSPIIGVNATIYVTTPLGLYVIK